MQPSLFTRVTEVEAELRAVKDVLAEMLDILAEVKANQDEMRREREEPAGAESFPMDPPLRWRRRAQARLMAGVRALPRFMRRRLADRDEPTTDKDDLAFWKEMARSAMTGLFLLTALMIGLYQLLRRG